MIAPRKISRVDNDATERSTVAADILGQRVHYNIHTIADGFAQYRCGYCVINYHWDTFCVGSIGNRRKIDNISGGIANAFTKDRLGFVINEFCKTCCTVILGKANFNSLLGQHVGK